MATAMDTNVITDGMTNDMTEQTNGMTNGVTLNTSTNAYEVPNGTGISSGVGSNPQLSIKVSSPFQESAPSKFGIPDNYMSYLIVTHTMLPQYSKQDFQVRRRFADVVALGNLLNYVYRGYVVPPLPPKQILQDSIQKVTSFKDADVEQRRKAMELYLNRIAQHRLLSRSAELRVFLELDGDLRGNPDWIKLHPVKPNLVGSSQKLLNQLTGKTSRIPSAADAAVPTSQSGDFLRNIKEKIKGQQLLKSGGPVGGEEAKLREDEIVFDETSKALKAVHLKSKDVQKAMSRMGLIMGELGVSVRSLASFELDNEVTVDEQAMFKLADTLKDMGNYTSKQSQSFDEVVDTLTYYVNQGGCVKNALKTRQDALVTVKTLENDSVAKRRQLEVEMNNSASDTTTPKAAALSEELNGLEHATSAAQREYELLMQRNSEDVGRLKEQQTQELADMVVTFTEVLSKFYARQAEAYTLVAKEMGVTDAEIY